MVTRGAITGAAFWFMAKNFPGLLQCLAYVFGMHGRRGPLNARGAIAAAMTSKSFIALSFGILLPAVFPFRVLSHDGKLDSYGCHDDDERKNYHCHEGVFKGGSFESKIEMIRQLKLQFLNLGRPWPYDDIAEEDITATEKQNH